MRIFQKLKWLILLIACALFVFLVPKLLGSNQYLLTVMCNALVFAIAVYGLNVMLGMGGQVTFSTAGIMGIGAYVTGICTTRFGMHPLFALLLSVVACAVFSLVLGLILFRLKGNYFAFATIAFAQIVYVVLLNWTEVTGGAIGVSGIPSLDIGFYVADKFDKIGYFYIIFFIAVVCGLIVYRIRSSSLGRSLACIRDNEIAARCMGVNVYRTQVISFVIAGAFAALSGSLYAYVNSYISAESFQFDNSALYLVMAMLGGIQSTVGSFIGAVLLTMLPEFIRFMQTYYKLVYGIGVMILMVFMPMGLSGAVKSLFYKISSKRKLKTLKAGKAAVKNSNETEVDADGSKS